MTTCAHLWPGELTPDAACLLGCGEVYASWSEPDDTSSLSASSLVPTTEEIEVSA